MLAQIRRSPKAPVGAEPPPAPLPDIAARSEKLPRASEETSSAFPPQAVFRAGLRHHHLANTAYPIAHRKTVFPYRRKASEHVPLLREALGTADRMGLYLHIPFCRKRCAFCEYTVVDGHTLEREEAYHRALLKEVDLYADLPDGSPPPLTGLDVGGGTPSLVDPRRMGELVDRVMRRFRPASGFGISIETTPRMAAAFPRRLALYRSMGIERISMGLQTANPRLLRRYGRDPGPPTDNLRAAENIRRAGFRRFNIDLMYGFARQKTDDFLSTVSYTLKLRPEYVTLYRMRYKGTRIAGEAPLVDLAETTKTYQEARRLLLSAGYQAPPGKTGFSRVPGDSGASEYLTQRVVWSTPYAGLGLGAQTFTNHLLAYNLGAASKRLGGYLRAVEQGRPPIQDLYRLPPAEGMGKMISVSFYFGAIHLEAFRQRFGTTLEERFPRETAFVLRRGLMEYRDGTLGLTEKGAARFNGVVALFYSDAVKEHLLSLEDQP